MKLARVALRLGLLTLAAIVSAGCSENEAGDARLPGLRISSVLGAEHTQRYAKAEAPRTFRFPEDHGPHLAFRSEWWYLTGVLRAQDGREFGMQWTLFRQALSPEPFGAGSWSTGQVYMAHLAVSDVASGRHASADRLARGHPELAGARADPFKLWIEDWLAAGEAGARGFSFDLNAKDAEKVGVALSFEQTRSEILQGEQGLSRKGPGEASYYYSIPRLKTHGHVWLASDPVEVTGWTWLDREWSTSVLSGEVAGWDWFALQLDDGRDVMAFRLRRHDGLRDPFDYAVVRGEQVTKFGWRDFELVPVRYWRDDDGTAWPVAWALDIPGGGLANVRITAMIEDQVMDLGIRYWEGLVAVTDPSGTLGRGYMELTGYDE